MTKESSEGKHIQLLLTFVEKDNNTLQSEEDFVMNDSGIISQYGFLYQRKVFVLYVLKNVNTKQLFTFEGKDDIEISSDEKIYAMFDSSNYYVQVKSGSVSEDCFSRVICNWLLIESTESSTYELVLEHDMDFDYSSQKMVEKIFNFILDGKAKKRTSIARKVYEKYKERILKQPDEILKQILDMITGFRKTVCSMEMIDKELLEKFNQDYCSDIQDFSLAKKKRLERFVSYVDKDINEAIKFKKPYTLIYSDFMRLIIQVSEEISDHKYTINTYYLKKKSEEKARKLVKERVSREVKQLYLVKDMESFVVKGIVNELIYKDFRDVYSQQKLLEVSNLEHNAKENFESALFTLNDNEDDPKSVYIKTIEQQIESDLLPQGSIYRTGCYIYLTGDYIEEDFQITWGKDNDSK